MQPPKSNHAEGFWLRTPRKRGRLWNKAGTCGSHTEPHDFEVWGMWRWRKRAEQHIAGWTQSCCIIVYCGFAHRTLTFFLIRPNLPLFLRTTASNSPKAGPAPLHVPTEKDLWRKASWAAVTNEKQVKYLTATSELYSNGISGHFQYVLLQKEISEWATSLHGK